MIHRQDRTRPEPENVRTRGSTLPASTALSEAAKKRSARTRTSGPRARTASAREKASRTWLDQASGPLACGAAGGGGGAAALRGLSTSAFQTPPSENARQAQADQPTRRRASQRAQASIATR